MSINRCAEEQAFEYVVGTLRSAERVAFKEAMRQDEALQATASFWEENMIILNPNEYRPPKPSTWGNIEAAIGQTASAVDESSITQPWYAKVAEGWRWGISSAAALMLVALVFISSFSSNSGPGLVTSEYIAVLTDASGRAVVTALSQKGDETKMSLSWELDQFTAGKQAQLWAVSKRDGQVRPLTVIERPDMDAILLDNVRWRLVTEADYLILTEEEPGGSALDIPSELVLAKGACVHLT